MKRSFRTRTPGGASPGPLGLALEEVAGAALVLDERLHVALATPRATTLLGFDIPVGESAPKLLCGESAQRPVAEALAAGRPIQAVLPRPTRDAPARVLRVRTTPLTRGRTRVGWLVFLEDATGVTADGEISFHGMWTQDAAMKRMFHVVERVADTDAPVLVRGETGTGKELVASAVHALSPRNKGPFRAINCAAVPPALIESELFGHVRGAFTGAVKDAPGHFQLAHRGTLFLDEVAELPLEMQAKLLRVLETGSVLPVGGRDAIPVDVRIVSATHRSLRAAAFEGAFRSDLMFRLRVIPVFLPPLRARTGDVMLLVRKLIEERNDKRARRRIERIAPATTSVLEAYAWPGNVRELRNVLEYAYAIGDGPVLVPADLPAELTSPNAGDDIVTVKAPTPSDPRPEAQRILAALERSAGSRERAAQTLGWSRVTLWRRMKELGL